jgi:hypothetical protein
MTASQTEEQPSGASQLEFLLQIKSQLQGLLDDPSTK